MARAGARQHHQITFAVLALGVSAFALLQSLVIPVLPTIQRELHTSQSAVTWVLTGYLLSASIMTPILGRIGDMIGKGRIFVVALSALAAGSLLAAVAPNIGTMIVARVIQGIGGGVIPLAFGIIRDEFPAERVTGAVGMIASLTAVGGGIGIALSGPIVDALNYRWLFWIPMILTMVAALAAVLFVPESPVRSPGRVSWLAGALLSAWLVALLVALSEGPAWGWRSGRVIGLLSFAGVLAAGWIRTELRARTPMIDMRMMRRAAIWTNNLVILLLGIGMYAGYAFLPQFAQTPRSEGYGFGASVTASGLMMLPSAVTMFFVGLVAGRLARRLGGKILVVGGCLTGAAAMAMFAFAHHHEWEIYMANAVQGVGLGLAFSAMAALVVAAVPPSQTGVATGMNRNIRSIGGSIGSAVMASIVTARLRPSGFPAESGYTIGFAVMAGAIMLAALAGLLIPKSSRLGQSAAEPARPVAARPASGDSPSMAASE